MTKKLTIEEMKHKLSPEMKALHSENQALRSELAEAKRASGEVSVIMDDVLSAVQQAERVKIEARSSGGKTKVEAPCSHVIHLTDLHIGQVTKPEQVEDLGEYNYAIATARMKTLAEKVIAKTDVQRSGYNVTEAVILGTGDWVSGDIHPELQFTNEFPAPVQAVKAGYLLGAFFMALAPHFKSIRAEMITLDNHGRLTLKPQASDGWINNCWYVSSSIAK